MKILLDGFTREEKIRFIYIDPLSRNLADERTIEKEIQKEIARIKKDKKKQLRK
jgi:hypothetical protein